MGIVFSGTLLSSCLRLEILQGLIQEEVVKSNLYLKKGNIENSFYFAFLLGLIALPPHFLQRTLP